MSKNDGGVSISTGAGDSVVGLTKEEYREVVRALRLYDDFLKEELRNIHATIAVPDAEKAADVVIVARIEGLNVIKGKFNIVSIKLAGNVKQAK